MYDRVWCESVRVVGEAFAVTFHPELRPPPLLPGAGERTASAWGTDVQSTIARLRVAVAGAGSVGALVAEALARMGVGELRLIDFDSVELINLDRLLYATQRSLRLERSKVENLSRHLRSSATASIQCRSFASEARYALHFTVNSRVRRATRSTSR